jgi:hypothetical protein
MGTKGDDTFEEEKSAVRIIPFKQENFVTLRLPEFNTRNPRVWFHQVEAVFSTRRITSQSSRSKRSWMKFGISTFRMLFSPAVYPATNP